MKHNDMRAGINFERAFNPGEADAPDHNIAKPSYGFKSVPPLTFG